MSNLNAGNISADREVFELAKTPRDVFVGGVAIVNRDGLIPWLPPEVRRMLALEPSDQPAACLEMLPAQLRELVRGAFASGEPIQNRQFRIATGPDSGRNLSLTALPVRSNGSIAGVTIVLRDLSAEQELDARLGRLDRLANLGALSAGLAHEIKNALVASRTFVELLLEKHQDSELVEVVQRELGRIDSLLNQMLRLAAPMPPTFAPVRLHQVLARSLLLVRHQFECKAVGLEQSCGAADDGIKGDDYQLEQAFLNLFLNALEAMGPHGTLTVATETLPPAPPTADAAAGPGTRLRVTVRDTGVGIAAEHLEHIFNPFFTTKPGGTGLGLAVTRRIIEAHGGTITAQSRPNQGTVFTIVLPGLACSPPAP